MDIRKAALIAEVVGGVGVVVSLVFVGVQVRTSAAAQDAQALLDLRLALSEVQTEMTSSPELSALMYRGYYQYADLSPVEGYRFRMWTSNVLNMYRIAFDYGRLGSVDAGELESWQAGACSYLSFPGVQQAFIDSPVSQAGRETFRAWLAERCPEHFTQD